MATSSVLKNLTMDQKRKAFEKARAEVNIPGVRLELITEEYYDMAIEFAREYYMKEEPIYKGVGMEWTDQLGDFWLEHFKLNLSLMLVDEETGKILALRKTRIARIDDPTDFSHIKSKQMKELFEYSLHCDEHADFFGHYGIDEAFHFLGLAVNKNYRRLGYGAVIFNAAISMIRHLGIDPVYIKAEGSSNYSKIFIERTGMETLADLPFDEWVVDGKRPIQNTGIHKSQKVYGLKVTQNDSSKVSQ